MILSIKCDKPSFKTIIFKPGFNIIIADKTDKSKPKDSRNALGKSLCIEIIHFCLGSDIKQNVGLGVKDLYDWTFTLEMELQRQKYLISRNTKDSKRIYLKGDFSNWPIKPEFDEESRNYYLMKDDWRETLGYLMFNLSLELKEKKFKPTFRSLFSYFCRRGLSGGYLSPFKHYSQQQEWDIQVNNAYLLNINWENASEWQTIKDKEKLLQDLKKAAYQGLIKDLIGDMGELDSYRINLLAEIKTGDENLKSFIVLPEYNKVQEETNILTEKIHGLSNENNITNQILRKYRENITEEDAVSIEKIKKVYEEVGMIFPVTVSKRINEVINFSQEIIKNRKDYLSTEIQRLQTEIKTREDALNRLCERRTEQMKILSTHGALEEFSKLQEHQTSLINQLKEIEVKINNLRRFEEGKSALKIEKEQLLIQTRRDLDARDVQKAMIIKYFNDHSKYLYSEPGTFSVNATDTGYKFKIDIKGSGSSGIEKMKIFCYDLSLIKILSENKNIQNFLIHDSVLFDGVDERQIAKALELAKNESEKYNFQYICTINSDMIPEKDLKKDFDINEYVVLKLTDATSDGGLFGKRF